MANLIELHLFQSLDTELASLADHFTNVVRAAQVPDEEEHTSMSKEKRAPGDMLEVWVEKLLYSGNTLLHILSQLKKGALLGDVNALVNNVRTVRSALERTEDSASLRIAGMKREVQELLGQMEASYYASEHRGRMVTANTAQELKELCQLACEAPSSTTAATATVA